MKFNNIRNNFVQHTLYEVIRSSRYQEETVEETAADSEEIADEGQETVQDAPKKEYTIIDFEAEQKKEEKKKASLEEDTPENSDENPLV